MPYITSELRYKLDPHIECGVEVICMYHPRDAVVIGSLVALLNSIYVESGPRYVLFNRMIGAIECARLELVRRLPIANKRSNVTMDNPRVPGKVFDDVADVIGEIDSDKQDGCMNYSICTVMLSVYGNDAGKIDAVLRRLIKEVYGTYIASYEDEAIKRNGDIL